MPLVKLMSSIHSKSILDCANAHKPLIMVAKLAYGAVYIYQQQVQFLYDKVSSAACHQTSAILDWKHSNSSDCQTEGTSEQERKE